MKGFCCDRCLAWYDDTKGARLQIRKSEDTDKNHPMILDLCNRCLASLQRWQVSKDPDPLDHSKGNQP